MIVWCVVALCVSLVCLVSCVAVAVALVCLCCVIMGCFSVLLCFCCVGGHFPLASCFLSVQPRLRLLGLSAPHTRCLAHSLTHAHSLSAWFDHGDLDRGPSSRLAGRARWLQHRLTIVPLPACGGEAEPCGHGPSAPPCPSARHALHTRLAPRNTRQRRSRCASSHLHGTRPNPTSRLDPYPHAATALLGDLLQAQLFVHPSHPAPMRAVPWSQGWSCLGTRARCGHQSGGSLAPNGSWLLQSASIVRSQTLTTCALRGAAATSTRSSRNPKPASAMSA